jgi:hypothetical protein
MAISYADQVANGKWVGLSGRRTTSWSLGGGSKKPLAIVSGTLQEADDEAPYEVEVHVHLQAEDPLDNYTGVNVREKGAAVGFVYWGHGILSQTPWLKRLMDAQLPDWSKKSTWNTKSVDTDGKIQWLGPQNRGWRFDQAMAAANRRANANFTISFVVGKGFGAGKQKSIAQALVPSGTKIVIQNKDQKSRLVVLTFENEQVAYEVAEDVEDGIRTHWPDTTFTYEGKEAAPGNVPDGWA